MGRVTVKGGQGGSLAGVPEAVEGGALTQAGTSGAAERTTRHEANPLAPIYPLRVELFQVLEDKRWGYALMSVGWIHLAFFIVGQACYDKAGGRTLLFLTLWAVELLAILAAMRGWLGRGWSRSCTLVNLTFKMWVTFLILSFNVASLNTLMGWSMDWFKPVWATLSTFVMMMLTFLVSPWFFAGAVWMYFTGLAMTKVPDWNYLIYGVSWCVAFQTAGVLILKKVWRKSVA